MNEDFRQLRGVDLQRTKTNFLTQPSGETDLPKTTNWIWLFVSGHIPKVGAVAQIHSPNLASK